MTDELTDAIAAALCEYDETHDDHWYNLSTDEVSTLIAQALTVEHAPYVQAPGVYCLACEDPWPCEDAEAASSQEAPKA